jgi:hypothetical protein
LRRALETPPADRERMGRAAADTVGSVCNNARIVAQHIELKGRLVSSPQPRPAVVPPPARAAGAVVTADENVELDPEFLKICAAASAAIDRPRATRQAPRRYSAMAQGLQRLHTPLLRWLLACAPEDQRAFVRQGLKHPARSARWLASQAKL